MKFLFKKVKQMRIFCTKERDRWTNTGNGIKNFLKVFEELGIEICEHIGEVSTVLVHHSHIENLN